MTESTLPPVGEEEARAHRLLQRELVTTRNRLDRQVRQLMRLNALSHDLGHHEHERPMVNTFAEAILDVLDVGFAAVWILDPRVDPDVPRFAACGAEVPDEWRAAGADLDAILAGMRTHRAVALAEAVLTFLPGVQLYDVMAARSLNRDGSPVAVVLAAHTATTVGMDDPLGDEAREVLSLIAERCAEHLDTNRDWNTITSQVRQLRESEERLELVLRGTNDGWWDWDIVHGTCLLSARWQSMLHYPATGNLVRDRFWDSEVHDSDRASFAWLLEQALSGDGDGLETELRLRCHDDSYLPVLVRGTILRDDHGLPIRFAGSILDLSERKRHEAHVNQLAFYDALTELPNRRLLMDRLQQSLLSNARTGQASAVLMIDLDRFKTLNDTHGHAAGDQLLRSVADRLRASVRGHDTVARLGGDEFVVLLENLDGEPGEAARAAEHLAAKVLAALNEPYLLDVGVTHHSASVGVVVTDEPGLVVDTVLKRADVAMYEAKAAGRNAVRIFRPDMQYRVDQRTALETRLREGFEGGQLSMMYQAQVDTMGRLFGAEALMRWHPDDGEPVPPSLFIPVAEESGLIREIGLWSLHEVCRQVVAWRGRVPAGFRVAVNISATEFMNPEFITQVVEALELTGARGSELRLEITEANVVTDLKVAADRINLLRSHGIEFALDDFGTGYSSLTYLRQLPVSEVKIDRSYVRRFLSDRHDEAIMRAILTLCASLGIRVIAEGVETMDQWHRLMDDDCAHFQGYLFGRALPPTDDPQDLMAESLAPYKRVG